MKRILLFTGLKIGELLVIFGYIYGCDKLGNYLKTKDILFGNSIVITMFTVVLLPGAGVLLFFIGSGIYWIFRHGFLLAIKSNWNLVNRIIK